MRIGSSSDWGHHCQAMSFYMLEQSKNRMSRTPRAEIPGPEHGVKVLASKSVSQCLYREIDCLAAVI